MISPEGLDIAEAYLRNDSNAEKAATALNLPVEEVHRYLQKREVKDFVDRIYNEAGFRNRHRFSALVEELIAHKLEELEETGMGSNLDIFEMLEKYHKMMMAQKAQEIKLMETKAKYEQPLIQVNQQTNNYGDNYNKLLEKLTGG